MSFVISQLLVVICQLLIVDKCRFVAMADNCCQWQVLTENSFHQLPTTDRMIKRAILCLMIYVKINQSFVSRDKQQLVVRELIDCDWRSMDLSSFIHSFYCSSRNKNQLDETRDILETFSRHSRDLYRSTQQHDQTVMLFGLNWFANNC